MIADKDIEQKAEFKLSPQDVEKDYVHSWVLKGIYARPRLAQLLVLKGGNAIRKAYLPGTRFSKDIDFSALSHVEARLLEEELREVCTFVHSQTGVTFLDKTVIKDKNLPIPDVEVLEARLYFKGFYNEENLTLKTQLDITQFERLYLPVQERTLFHPYPDAAECSGRIKCQKLEEILASKLTALLHRRKPVDLFDLLYSIVVAKEYPVARREVISTFLKKSIFEPRPTDAKIQLLAVPVKEFESTWASLVVPTAAALAFTFVVQNFTPLIESLFSLVATTTAAPVVGAGGRIARSGGIGGYGGATTPLGFGPAFFAWNARDAIISAGRNLVMIDLLYDGYQRLVEPYKLQYYVRKSDGRGLEYFWGYDTSGGKSGKTGIKMFICDKIESVRPTSRSFTPRFEVEL